MSAIDDIDDHVPEPCTPETLLCGCTCHRLVPTFINSKCPLHGWRDDRNSHVAEPFRSILNDFSDIWPPNERDF